jgi:hypothetical protein
VLRNRILRKMFGLQVELIHESGTAAGTNVSFEVGAVLLNQLWWQRRPESMLGMGW